MNGMGNNISGPKMPTAPPPPPEVKVRTMRSDLESIAKSGGGLPRFQSVKVTGLSLEEKSSEEIAPAGRNKMIIILIAVAALAALALIGYFAYSVFFAGGAKTAELPQPSTGTSAPLAQRQNSTVPAQNTAPSAAASFTHASLFKKPADQILTLTLSSGGPASSATDLATFNQKLSAVLATAKKTANVIEIDAKTADGRDLNIEEVLSRAGAQILDPAFLAAHFNPDATIFVYQDKDGFWPGYVLSLKPGENWLFLQNDVAKLELSTSITNFFLQNAGTPSANGFVGSTVSSTAVRILPFSGGIIPVSFVYGWSKSDLILSTSRDGFAQAVARLQLL